MCISNPFQRWVIIPLESKSQIPLPTSCASHCQLASSPLSPLRALQQLLRCDTAQTWWCKQSQIYLSSSCPEIFTRSNRRYSALPSRWLPWQTCACPTWIDQIQVVAILALLVQLLPCANTGFKAEGEFWEVNEALLASVRSVECKGLEEELSVSSKT